MKDRLARALAGAFALATLGSAGVAQTRDLIDDLGDPVRGEAAEIALLARGADAVPLLVDLFTAWVETTPRDVERLRSALRVVDMLGAGHDALEPVLRARWRGFVDPLGFELLRAHASLHPLRRMPRGNPLLADARTVVPARGWRRVATELLRSTMRIQNLTRIGPAQRANPAARDHVFWRELDAEVARLDEDPRTADSLRMQLRDRDRLATNATLLWNGIPVPIVDGFALQASLAIVKLSPDDPTNAIAWAHIAASHPHRTTAFAALRAAAGHGPANATAVPELLTVFDRGDPELTIEALKVLSLTGEALADALPALAALAGAGNGEPHRLAAQMVERAERQGLRPEPAAKERQQRRARMAAIAALLQPPADADATAALTTRLLADRDAAWTALSERYLQDGGEAADWLVHQLGAVGRAMPIAVREPWRRAIASPGMQVGWQGRRLCGTRGVLSPPRALAYARLTIGQSNLPELAGYLMFDNAAVRLVAARELAQRAAEVAAAGASLHATLRRALAAAQPTESMFDICNDQKVIEPFDCADAVRGAIAAALLDVTATAEQQSQQLQQLLAHDDADAIARGLSRWGATADEPLLFLASKDRRAAVAAAATAELTARGGR